MLAMIGRPGGYGISFADLYPGGTLLASWRLRYKAAATTIDTTAVAIAGVFLGADSVTFFKMSFASWTMDMVGENVSNDGR